METTTKRFEPFQKVLVRYLSTTEWIPAIYCRFEPVYNRHQVIGHRIEYDDTDIIPYEGNEYLTGTNIEPDDNDSTSDSTRPTAI